MCKFKWYFRVSQCSLRVFHLLCVLKHWDTLEMHVQKRKPYLLAKFMILLPLKMKTLKLNFTIVRINLEDDTAATGNKGERLVWIEMKKSGESFPS